MNRTPRGKAKPPAISTGYDDVLACVVELLESARRASARAVNAVITAAYWEVGRWIVECEQRGKEQAAYGKTLVIRLAADLTQRFGRGFGKSNLYQMRTFYLAYQDIFQTLSRKSPPQQNLWVDFGWEMRIEPRFQMVFPGPPLP